ncbi:MAG: S9 family peptidase, partial [bacterium]
VGMQMHKSLEKTFLCVLIGLLVGTFFSAAPAQPRRPAGMSPADILHIAGVSDAQISPNGQWVVYTVSTVEGDETINTLWLARVGINLVNVPTTTPPPTGQRRPTMDWPKETYPSAPLLAGVWNASNPRWSPDSSKIAFLSERNAQRGLWVVNLEKGDPSREREPRFIAVVQTTNFFITYAGESLVWAPDSKRIAYVSATEDITPAIEDINETPETTHHDDPRVIDRIQYKSRTSFSDKRRTHVWITAIDKPEPRQLTSGDFYDHAITFSPSGDEIAFLSNHETDPDANNNSDLFAVDIHGEVRQITVTKGCEYEPTWSPDGKWIAYTATKRDVTTIDSVAEDTHVWVVGANGSNRAELSLALDRRARNPQWSADSRQVLFLAGDRGETTVFRVPVGGGKIQRLFLFISKEGYFGVFDNPEIKYEDRIKYLSWPYQITNFSVSKTTLSLTRPDGIISSFSPLAFTLADSLYPSEAFVVGGNGSLRELSYQNHQLTKALELQRTEEIDYESFDGTRIQGWLLKPVGWREDRKYPLILSIHGGPHGMSGWAFNPTFQVYAARGYAVLFLNPRGSNGYGQKFSDGTLNEWGGGDYKDLMAGVDEALRKYSWIDKDRMGVTGGSYGGFMTNWIITQTPRFKAAVSVASLSNLISFYSTSLYQDLIHAEFGGFPWDNYEQLWQWSPLRYVKQAQTPTLFIHGEQDNDVHITQAEEMYTALKRRGIETVLVRYPREGHGLREPKHRVDALERTLAWFDRYLK